MNQVDKILIIPEQYAMLQKQYEATVAMNELQIAMSKMQNRDVREAGDEWHAMIPDECADRERAMTLATLYASRQILENYTLVDSYSKDVIDVGTRCQVLMKDSFGNSVEDIILIHKRVANEPVDLFVSCDTILGITLKGHKAGDIMQYKNHMGQLCSVEILKIYDNRLGEETKEEQKLR